MDQTALPVTAPNDPDPKWPDGYVAVLRVAGAQEKTIPYCIGWVRRFFARFPGRSRRSLGRGEIETFLAEIAAHPGIGNWQVQQARDALELYYAKFRGIALEPRDAVIEANHPKPPSHERARIQNATIPYTRPDTAVKGGNPVANASGRDDARRPESSDLRSGTGSGAPCAHVTEAGAGDRGVTAVGGGRCNWKVLEERLKDVLRTEHYAYATEQSYVAWIKRYVAFHGWRKPSTLEAEHVHAFLKHLAREAQVASSTQNQAA